MLPPGSRRSKIRPPRKSLVGSVGGNANGESGSDGAVDFEKSWSVLSNAIVQIQRKNVSSLSYEQLYRKAYLLVLRKFGAKLYDSVTQLIAQHLLERRSKVLDIFTATSSSSVGDSINEDFMKAVLLEWDEHLQSMKFISDVLMYLNRVYVKENKKLLIYDLGIQLFKNNFVKYNDNEIGEKLITIVIQEITKSRKGEVITSKMYIDKVINMVELLVETDSKNNLQYGENYYQRYFEDKLLENSKNFFYNLSEDYIMNSLGSKYLHDIYQFIKDEENRIAFYLPATTYPKLINLMNNILIKDKIDRVINFPLEQHGLSYLLEPILVNIFNQESDRVELFTPQEPNNFKRHHITELKILYELIGRIDTDHNLLKIRLKELVINQGCRLPTLVIEALQQTQSETSNAPNKKPQQFGTNSTSFAIKWVDSVLEFQNQYSFIVRESFDRDVFIEQTISVAMREFINGSSSSALRASRKASDATSINGPEILSVYMDYFIKQLSKSSTSGAKRVTKDSSSNGISVDQTDDLINKSILFLKFIKDKDAFEAHYANHFAKRFLHSKGVQQPKLSTNTRLGNDLEELIISKLGEEMGSASLEKVIKMNKDIKLSHDLTVDWKKYVSSTNKKSVIDLDLKICNVSDWPKSMTKDYKNFSRTNDVDGEVGFIWSSQLRQTIKDFEEFWFTNKKNDNKSLFWCPKFGSMDLRITYPTKTYDINMSTYAGIIMLLFAPQSTDANGDPVLAFEEARSLNYQEIKELTKIPEMDLKRQLQSIAVAPRLRLLTKTPLTKEINDDDVFRLNDKFKSPSPKVKVLTVSASSSSSKNSSKNPKKTENEEESEEVQANITEGRKIVVNAAIVRIMKSRQTITHNDLVAELVKQLHNRFQPLTILIKQRIEDLIEKEYLKRDDDLRNTYHYVA